MCCIDRLVLAFTYLWSLHASWSSQTQGQAPRAHDLCCDFCSRTVAARRPSRAAVGKWARGLWPAPAPGRPLQLVWNGKPHATTCLAEKALQRLSLRADSHRAEGSVQICGALSRKQRRITTSFLAPRGNGDGTSLGGGRSVWCGNIGMCSSLSSFKRGLMLSARGSTHR